MNYSFERILHWHKGHIQKAHDVRFQVVYKIPYRRARAWPSGCAQPLGRVRRASKGILHTSFQGDMNSMLNRTICPYVVPAECFVSSILNFEIVRAYPKSGCTVARFGIFNKVKVRFLFKPKFYFIVK